MRVPPASAWAVGASSPPVSVPSRQVPEPLRSGAEWPECLSALPSRKAAVSRPWRRVLARLGLLFGNRGSLCRCGAGVSLHHSIICRSEGASVGNRKGERECRRKGCPLVASRTPRRGESACLALGPQEGAQACSVKTAFLYLKKNRDKMSLLVPAWKSLMGF